MVAPDAAFRDERDIKRSNLLNIIKLNKNIKGISPDLYKSLILTPQELNQRFMIHSDALRNSSELWTKLCVSDPQPLSVVMPETKGAESDLRHKVISGLGKRLGCIGQRVMERAERELRVINSMGYASYFLIAQEVASMGSRVCGRGSSAGSCVAWALGITDVNPMDYELLFERFLDPERRDPPDIDIDFPWDERDSVLREIFIRYKGYAAMTAAFHSFEFRGAVRETAMCYGFSGPEISRVSERLPSKLSTKDDISSVLSSDTGLREFMGSDRWQGVFRGAYSITGLVKSIGTHCGGVVITPSDITGYAPLGVSASGRALIQWDKRGIERMGLVKMDILGNRSLSVIRDCFSYLKEDQGVEEEGVDCEGDTAVQGMIAAGDTAGVFYVESPGMRQLQRKTGLGDPGSLTVHSSLIRPAANRYTTDYIKRGYMKVYNSVPRLFRELFSESRGIMVFQEDVMRLGFALGMSYSGAVRLRRSVSKGDPHEIQRAAQEFYRGGSLKGIVREEIDAMWNACLSFKGYSFCKAHSASYVRISFQAAWLKYYFPAYFFACVIDNRGGYYPLQFYVSEARRAECRIVPPDINKSLDRTCVRDGVIVTGFLHVRGLKRESVDKILSSRGEHGFSSLRNMFERSRLPDRCIEALIVCGSCDSFGERDELLREFVCLSTSGFRIAGYLHRKWGRNRELVRFRMEYYSLGFITERHPAELVERGSSGIFISEVGDYTGRETGFTGYCCAIRTHVTEKGESMVFMSLDDETGVCECVVFPGILSELTESLSISRIYDVYGVPRKEFGAVTFEVHRVEKRR